MKEIRYVTNYEGKEHRTDVGFEETYCWVRCSWEGGPIDEGTYIVKFKDGRTDQLSYTGRNKNGVWYKVYSYYVYGDERHSLSIFTEDNAPEYYLNLNLNAVKPPNEYETYEVKEYHDLDELRATIE